MNSKTVWMNTRSLLLHLRFPFSFFLLPVFLFAFSQATQPYTAKTLWVFFILHFLIYPASNAFNSYFDKDEGPIGGLQNPPPVNQSLYYVSLLMDALALIFGWFYVGTTFALACLLYSLVSRAYSHPMVRLKKYAILSWLVVSVFQGGFTYLTVIQAVDTLPVSELNSFSYLFPALLATLNLLGFYPMTQIYQHEEDARRGDRTISRMMGIKGTFLLTATIFLAATLGFFAYFTFQTIADVPIFVIYLLIMAPVLTYFGIWFLRVLKNTSNANFRYTMGLNLLGSLCLNLFFGILCLQKF